MYILFFSGWANKFDHVKMTSKFVIVHKEETRNKIAINSDSQKNRFSELKKLLHSFSSFPESTETQNFVEEGEEEDIRSDTNLLMIESKEQVNGHSTSNVNNVPEVVSLMREARLAAASAPASASASGINDPKSKIQDDTQHHTVPDAPNLGELLDFRGSDRVVLSPSEKAKEMQKIRDRQLFGVHGQRVKRHKKHGTNDMVLIISLCSF